MVTHNFKIGDIVETVSKPLIKNNRSEAGAGFVPNKTLVIEKIDNYPNESIMFFENHCNGIRWTSEAQNFYLKHQVYELW